MIFSPVKWLPCVLLFFSLLASAQEIPSGDSRGASITPGTVQTWAFATQAGKTTYLQVAAVSGAPFAPTIRVYDPQGVQVVSDTGGQTAATYFTASKTGTFTVQVADTATPDGPTVYRIFHTSVSGPQVVPAGDEGGELGNGELRVGTISPGDIDTWTYQANADEEVVIHVTKTTPSSLRPQIFVYGPNGERYGGESSALDVVSVRCTPNVGGRFTVMVKDGNSHAPGSGDYQIEVSRPLAPFTVAAGDEGGALANGGNHEGVITKGDMDLWTFSADAGEEVFFTLGKTDASSLAPSILLFSPQGTPLSPNNTYSGEYRITIPTGGRHAVLVRDGNLTGSGGYRLGFLRTGADFIVPAGDEGGLLVNGGKYTGTISPGEIDAWHFRAEAGEQLLIRVSETADTALTPNLELFGPGGRRVAFYVGGQNSTSLDYLTTEAGEYVLTLRDRNSPGLQTASYNLYFSQSRGPVIIPPGDEGGPLVSGVNRAGSIPRGDIDTWTFEGLAGQDVIFSMVEPVASSLEPWMRLFGPDGEEVGDNGTTSLQARLPKAGSYSWSWPTTIRRQLDRETTGCPFTLAAARW